MTTLEEYEEMKPKHARHRAIIKKILYESLKLHGLTLDQIDEKLVNFLESERIRKQEPKKGRKRPTVDNRMREIKKETDCTVVCLRGVDGLNHHWHVDRWKDVPKHKIHLEFPALQTGILQIGEVLPIFEAGVSGREHTS